MDKNKLVRKLYAYRQDPELYRAPSNEDLADLVILVLNAVKTIEDSMEKKRVDVEKKYDKEAKNVLSKADKQSRDLLSEVRTEVNRLINDSQSVLGETKQELETRVQQALQNIRDGRDGIVTDDEIERAASIAAGLIELPDFDALISERTTANPQAVRDALELLSGDDRYKVEITDVQGLQERLESLVRSNGGGTIGKGQVYGFIRQAIADGTISTGGATNLGDLEDVNDTAPTANQVLTWNNVSEEWEPADPPGASGGEANTVSNLGTGEGTFSAKVGVDLRFKSLIGGTGISLSSDANEVTIARDALSASDISDFDTEVSNNTDVAANTSARHAAVTVTDSAEIDFTLTGQDITAVLKAGSIDETKLDTSVNASLDLADSATQPGDALTTLSGDLPFSQVEQIATNRILGRSTAGTGDVEALADGAVRGIIGLDTDDSPQFAGVNVGHATDTTISRVGAGVIAVEGTQVARHGDNLSDFVNDAGFITTETDDQVASEVPFTPAGNIAATDVQAAIQELDTEKASASHTHLLAAGATDVTATAAEVNVLDGITATTAELNYTDGVTSNIQTQLNGKADISTSINAQTGTTYTLVLADASKNVTMTNASANTLTVPPNSSVAFPVGTKVLVTQSGAGATTIAAGAGVTINAPSTVTLAIDEQHESRGLLKTGSDTWTLL